MLDDLRELYQEMILDHGKNPRNLRHPEDCSHRAMGNNPMCGDIVTIYLVVDKGGVIRDAAFEGKGCAISVASTSMMTEILKGRTTEEAERLFEHFREMCTNDDYDLAAAVDEDPEAFERLQMLAGVRKFPMRVKCATLAWHTMEAALNGLREASTE